jgi:hypothetical protein
VATGDRIFARVQGLYELACNNAVIGAVASHPTIVAALTVASELRVERATRLYELGPRLLQGITGNESSEQFKLHPPEVFYPYSPEICWHLFRADASASVESSFGEQTRIVHLYDSVVQRRLGRPADLDFIRQSRGMNLLTRMVEPFIDELLACGVDG